jgi:hypothetical protein
VTFLVANFRHFAKNVLEEEYYVLFSLLFEKRTTSKNINKIKITTAA